MHYLLAIMVRSQKKTQKQKKQTKWYIVSKIVLNSCEKKLLLWMRNAFVFEPDSHELVIFLRSIRQFNSAVNGQNNFWNWIHIFKFVTGGSYLSNKDLFIKNRPRPVVTLVMFWFDFLWISVYIRKIKEPVWGNNWN